MRSFREPVGCAVLMAVAMAAVLCLFGVRRRAKEPPTAGGTSQSKPESKSATELNKELANPVSSLWSLSFQQNNYYLQNPSRGNSNLEPIASYFFGQGWSIGYSGNVPAHWEADSGNAWTVPIGASVSKEVNFGSLPVEISLAGQYMPIHPDQFGQQWDILPQMVPIIPALIEGPILCE